MYRGFSSQCLLNVFKSEPTKYFNDYGVDMSTIGSHATFLFYFLIYFGVDMSMVVLHISRKRPKSYALALFPMVQELLSSPTLEAAI